ncbi:MAG: protein kinase [Saccharolobus sp.]
MTDSIPDSNFLNITRSGDDNNGIIQLPNIENWDPRIWVGRRINEYEVFDLIGVGSTSYVLKVRKGNRYYAMKIPKIWKSDMDQSNAHNIIFNIVREFVNLQEISMMSQNVVKPYAINESSPDTIVKIEKGDSQLYLTKPPYIVMELMEGGNALELSNKVSKSEKWYKVIAIIVKEIAKTLDVVHSAGYVHLDVKPQNIYFSKFPGVKDEEIIRNLVNGNTLVKLGDFGSTRRIGEKVDHFTEHYCSFDQVEAAMLRNKVSSPSMDIFALAAVAYNLLFDSYIYPREYYDSVERAVAEYPSDDFIYYLSLARKALIIPQITNLPDWFGKLLYDMLTGRVNANEVYNTIERNLDLTF